MSRTIAEAQLPKRVDAVKLVHVNQELKAKINTENLARLQQAVLKSAPEVECEIEFHQDQEKHKLLIGSCKTKVTMTCERCLEEVELPIASEFQLGLVFNDEQAKQLPKNLEPVELEEDGHLDLWAVVEDEVLLALPILPMHPEGQCRLDIPEPEAEIPELNAKRPNPFDVLAQLKQK
ncbi:MAG: YceD family protein [Venatoribacter sp.]